MSARACSGGFEMMTGLPVALWFETRGVAALLTMRS
jgi:hypothetical protein